MIGFKECPNCQHAVEPGWTFCPTCAECLHMECTPPPDLDGQPSALLSYEETLEKVEHLRGPDNSELSNKMIASLLIKIQERTMRILLSTHCSAVAPEPHDPLPFDDFGAGGGTR